MINVPVCIIGCGPIGLTGALLLAKFGVDSLVIERRDEVNTHPRSRFVDTNTMELTAPLATFAQDVIFEADLSEYVEGRKAGLLYNATPGGVLVFQPLNGITRWRCQIFSAANEPLTESETIARIREAAGADDEVPITITSTGMWQPTPGCVDRLSGGRVFLAGDAAHVSVPTGGMGNNIGFAGIRNLAWKIAYVLKGVSPPGILDTYHIEHRPIALERLATGVHTTECMAKIFFAFYAGQDTSEAVRDTAQYADYDGVLLGFELQSALIAKNPEPPPAVDNPTRDFVPAVRAGRRAPHVWVDARRNRSVLDWFGMEYVLVGGASVAAGRWREAVRRVAEGGGFPVCWQQLPRPDAAPYDPFGLALVRPDGIIADCWSRRRRGRRRRNPPVRTAPLAGVGTDWLELRAAASIMVDHSTKGPLTMAEAQAEATGQTVEFGANWVGPYELSEELRPRIEELGLSEAVEQFREYGYALIREAGPPSLMDELREAIHMYAKVRDKAGGMAGAPMLLGKHPAVDKVATLPKIMAFGEFACGKAMRVGRIVGSIKRKGQGGPGVHSDSNWMPIPLPEHNLLATFCVACEGMTEEGGATMVVPGSHRLRRPPSPEEAQSAKTVCIEAEKGDVAVWDGAIWHGSPERKIEGTRTVLHATYQRLYTQPIDDFRYLLEDEEYMASAPEGMRQLLGADLFFHTAKGETDTDMTKFAYAMEASKV